MIYQLGLFLGLLGSVLSSRHHSFTVTPEKQCIDVAKSDPVKDEIKRLDASPALRPRVGICELCTFNEATGQNLQSFFKADIHIQPDILAVSESTKEGINGETDTYWHEYADPESDIHWTIDCDDLFGTKCKETRKLSTLFVIQRAFEGGPFTESDKAQDYIKIRYRVNNDEWIDYDETKNPGITFRGAIRVIEFRVLTPCGVLSDHLVFTIHRHKPTLCTNFLSTGILAVSETSASPFPEDNQLETILGNDYVYFQLKYNARDIAGKSDKDVEGIQCSFKYDGYITTAGETEDLTVDPVQILAYNGEKVTKTYAMQLLYDSSTHPFTRASVECKIDYKDVCQHYCLKQTTCTKRFTAKDTIPSVFDYKYSLVESNDNVKVNGICGGNILTYHDNQVVFRSNKLLTCAGGDCTPMKGALSDLKQCIASGGD